MKIVPAGWLSAFCPGALHGHAPEPPPERKGLISHTAAGPEIDLKLLCAIQDQLRADGYAVPELEVADAMLQDAHFLERWLS